MSDMIEEKKSSSAKLNGFVEKNKKGFICGLCAIIVAIVVFVVVDLVKNSSTEKSLSKIDEISYSLTNESAALTDDELSARRATAKDALVPFTKKSGITGVRANMLCAELEYQERNYSEALSYWKATAAKGKKMYTAPVATYNIAVCYEELNDLENAAENYKIAADSDFLLKNHAKFSYGRVLEAQGKYSEAVEAYKELNDVSPDESWAKIAKSRILILQTEGKAE